MDINMDDKFPMLGMGDTEDGDMAMFGEYDEIDLLDTNQKIEKIAKDYVSSLCTLYLNTELFTNEQYVKSIENIESMNLTNLLLQVKYSEHVLKTIITQFNNGGYMNGEVYKRFRDQQKSCVDITLDIARYTRSIPDYIQSVKENVEHFTGCDIEVLSSNIPNSEIDENGEPIDTDTEVDVLEPQMGTKAVFTQMLKHREEAMQEWKEIDEENEEKQKLIDENKTPIEIKDDDLD